MWTEGNYRRNLLDMHIDDSDPVYLSRVNPKEYADALKAANVQAVMLKCRPHTGLAYYPTKFGRMHKGLKGFDFFGETVKLCHERGIVVEAYFSQIFDNLAYEQHPDWRVVTAEGKNMREYRGGDNFKSGRYGIVCPNNMEYRAYVKNCLTEMLTLYDFEGIFLDMTFWPEVCYCKSCQERYLKETGKMLPKTVDWESDEWKAFLRRRDDWMTEYAAFATKCVKDVKPGVTVEHQFSRITGPWVDACTEDVVDHVDYAGGDYYGGYLQQTFINKYYKSVSPTLPFIYHTSRCDPELSYHTTTKTEEQLLLHALLALVHNGAFLLVDAVNPDGSIVPEVYTRLMKKVYEKTIPYESYVNGQIRHDVSIWFNSHAKYDPHEKKCGVMDKIFWPGCYMQGPVSAADVLRESNIPFDVIGTRNIKDEKAKVLILSHVASIGEKEMDLIEDYVNRGGSLYVSGPLGNERLAKLLGVTTKARTKHTFTYMSPTKEGEKFFPEFNENCPLTLTMAQEQVDITDHTGLTVLATTTLPYTVPGEPDFAAIHSNPPGIRTEEPAAILKTIGNSKILWCAAPIEMQKPYQSRRVFEGMIRFLTGETSYTSNAPKFVEILSWEKDGETYFAAVNEQEESPVAPMYEITIDVPGDVRAELVPAGEELKTEAMDGKTRIFLPKLNEFLMFKLK